ncbi:MAG: hypothetical protein HYZ28_23670 [Myxococcales bacterium]|nr:hypothetical protein [Myxococcales bacterium]
MSSEERLDPTPIRRFDPTEHLEGGWRVRRYLPGEALLLEQEKGEQVRGLLRKLTVLVVPLLLAAMLIAGTQAAPGDLRLVTYPVAVLCLVVVLIGLLTLPREIRRIRHGVRLEVDAKSGRACGFPVTSEVSRALSDLQAKMKEVPLSEVKAVKLTVHRGGGRQGLMSRADLELVVEGASLQGPFATAADPEWAEARDALLPLACELARVGHLAVEIDCRWRKEQFTLSAEQVRQLPPGVPLAP